MNPKPALVELARLKLAMALRNRRTLTQEERDAVAELPRLRRELRGSRTGSRRP